MTNADTTGMVPVTITGVAVRQGDGPDRCERFSIMLESAADGDSRRLLIGVGDGAQVFVASELLEHAARPRECGF